MGRAGPLAVDDLVEVVGDSDIGRLQAASLLDVAPEIAAGFRTIGSAPQPGTIGGWQGGDYTGGYACPEKREPRFSQ